MALSSIVTITVSGINVNNEDTFLSICGKWGYTDYHTTINDVTKEMSAMDMKEEFNFVKGFMYDLALNGFTFSVKPVVTRDTLALDMEVMGSLERPTGNTLQDV